MGRHLELLLKMRHHLGREQFDMLAHDGHWGAAFVAHEESGVAMVHGNLLAHVVDHFFRRSEAGGCS